LSIQVEHIESSNGTVIKLLRYHETNHESFDLNLFSMHELSKFNEFKSIKRKNEFYFTRVLWHHFNIQEPIQYNHIGRPILTSGFISISHSGNVIAIAYNPHHAVGVDVEFHSPKLKKIQNKFVSENDADLADLKQEGVLTIIWSIKEAIYKMEQIEGLSFKKNIHVRLVQNIAHVDVIKDSELHHYTFEFSDFGDFVLTYCSHADLNGKTLF
jgi:4'-phosphopantetheinyl transferase EntD